MIDAAAWSAAADVLLGLPTAVLGALTVALVIVSPLLRRRVIFGVARVTVPGEKIQELPAQGVVALLPAAAPLVTLFLGESLPGQPFVIGVIWPDLDVGIGDDRPVISDSGVGYQEVAAG